MRRHEKGFVNYCSKEKNLEPVTIPNHISLIFKIINEQVPKLYAYADEKKEKRIILMIDQFHFRLPQSSYVSM